MKFMVITLTMLLMESLPIRSAEVNKSEPVEPAPIGSTNTPEKRSIGGMLLPLLSGLSGMGNNEDFGSNNGGAAGGLLGMIGSLLSNRMGLGGGGLKLDFNARPPQADNFGSSSNSYSGSAPSPGIALNLDFSRISDNLEKGLRFGKAAMSTGGSLLNRILQAQSSNVNYNSGPVPTKNSYPEPPPHHPTGLRSGPSGAPPPRHGRHRAPPSGIRGPSAEIVYDREPIYIRDPSYSPRPKASKSYSGEEYEENPEIVLRRKPQYFDSATVHQPFYSESPKNGPPSHLDGLRSGSMYHPEGLRSSPSSHPEGLRSSPSSHPDGLRSSPSSYPEGLRSSPSSYPEGLRSSQPDGLRNTPSSYPDGFRNNPSSYSDLRNHPSSYPEDLRNSPSSYPEGLRQNPSSYIESPRNSPSFAEGLQNGPSSAEDLRSYSGSLTSNPIRYSEGSKIGPESSGGSPIHSEGVRSSPQMYSDGNHGSFADYQESGPTGSQEVHSVSRHRSHPATSAGVSAGIHQQGYPEENEIATGSYQSEQFGASRPSSHRGNGNSGQSVQTQNSIQQAAVMPIGLYEQSQNLGSSIDSVPASEYRSNDYDQGRYSSETRDYDANISGSQSAGRGSSGQSSSGYSQQP